MTWLSLASRGLSICCASAYFAYGLGAVIIVIGSLTLAGICLPMSGIASEQSDFVKTLAEVERDHILSILTKPSGKISGPGGATEILMMPPTTLKSKIKELGIRKRFYQ